MKAEALAIAVALSSCQKLPTRAEVDATLWLNNGPIPIEICQREPALKDRGFYRRLNNGKLEFISWCSPKAREMTAVPTKELQAILDELLPKN